MRTTVHFFIVWLLFSNIVPVNHVFAQEDQEKHLSTESSYFYDFGKIFYNGFWEKDQDWLFAMMADSIIVGETFSDGLYCSKEKIVEFFAGKNLPEPKKIKIKVCGENEEKTIIFLYKKQIIFTICVGQSEKKITHLGVGEYLLKH